MLSLGAIVTGSVTVFTLVFTQLGYKNALLFFSSMFILGGTIEAIGLYFHAKEINQSEHEGAASHYIQLTTFGKSYLFRNVILLIALVGGSVLTLIQSDGLTAVLGWSLSGFALLFSSIISRALFYILVIPTTMPGAFFGKTKGLNNMPKISALRICRKLVLFQMHTK